MKAEIKKIVLDLGDKEVELNIKQAKKFHQLLDDMFGSKHVIIEKYPIYIERYRPYWKYDRTTWQSSDDLQMTYTNNTLTLRGSNVSNEAHKLVDSK